jgi:lysozyme family protein
MDFNTAFSILIGHEGGYVNDPADPGGETKFGISKRAYPDVDIANLTIEQAQAIYKKDYWDAIEADKLPDEVRFSIFDAAVNSGVTRAIKWLQQTVKVRDDGVIGPVTLNAAIYTNPYKINGVYNGIRLRFMTNLPTFSNFGRGWSKRIATNLINV